MKIDGHNASLSVQQEQSLRRRSHDKVHRNQSVKAPVTRAVTNDSTKQLNKGFKETMAALEGEFVARRPDKSPFTAKYQAVEQQDELEALKNQLGVSIHI